MMLPDGASDRSRELWPLALELAEACPLELGIEIALAGSVSRGWADEHSDIELNFWVEEIEPWPGERVRWLQGLGVERIIVDDEAHHTGSWWMEFVYKGTWVEIGWHSIGYFDRLLQRIVAGEVEDMFEMTAAEMMAHSIALRDGPNLGRWREMVRVYPETLRRAMIALGTKDWGEPHYWELGALRVLRPDATIAVLRGESCIRNLLRVLFAVNRQWQPDMRKWTRQWAGTLEKKPERLAERVLSIFERPIARSSHAELLDLVAETLALVPDEYGVAETRRVVENARESWGAWESMA
ncbi:MAG: DUF4037 domain-containing protein [Chloroflexota bacterium]